MDVPVSYYVVLSGIVFSIGLIGVLIRRNIEIIRHLQENGRKSFIDIANEMVMSVNGIRNRYQLLSHQWITLAATIVRRGRI